MPLANARHERFAQELAKGASQSEAYQLAGYRGDRRTASRLATNGDIQARVAEIQNRAAEAVGISKEWVIDRLVENVKRALQAKAILDEDGNPVGEYRYEGSVANRALELLGKEIGMFVERRESKDEHRVVFEEIRRTIVRPKANGAARTDQAPLRH